MDENNKLLINIVKNPKIKWVLNLKGNNNNPTLIFFKDNFFFGEKWKWNWWEKGHKNTTEIFFVRTNLYIWEFSK